MKLLISNGIRNIKIIRDFLESNNIYADGPEIIYKLYNLYSKEMWKLEWKTPSVKILKQFLIWIKFQKNSEYIIHLI